MQSCLAQPIALSPSMGPREGSRRCSSSSPTPLAALATPSPSLGGGRCLPVTSVAPALVREPLVEQRGRGEQGRASEVLTIPGISREHKICTK